MSGTCTHFRLSLVAVSVGHVAVPVWVARGGRALHYLICARNWHKADLVRQNHMWAGLRLKLGNTDVGTASVQA